MFDLNGKTLYFSGYRWDVTGNLAFKNGTIEVIDTNNYVFHGNPGNNAILLFENVTFNVSFAEGYIGIAAVELYSGILKIISSEVNIDGPAVLVQFTDTVRHNLLVKDSSIKAGSLVLTKYTSGLTDSYTVTGSLIDLSGAMLVFDGSYSGRGDTIAVSITSSSVKSNGIVSATGSLTSAIYTLLLSEVFLTAEPVLADTVGTVSIAGGERIMPVSGNGFAYRVTVPKASFKANLLLESNFGVRFFIPEGTNIVSLEIGGILYTVADLTDIIDYDGVVYKLITVKNIGPVNAADSFALNVVFEKDGVLHTVNSSYSVIDYISTLLETDYSTVIKRLAVSCADYIAAAYVYEGKVSPELTALLESATYLANKPQVFTPGNVTTDLGALDTAISGVQLDLGSEMKIRFNFNSAYSGTLTVMDKTYEVAGGKVGEFDYVEVTMPAHELYDTVIVITADGACGTYSLTQYVTSKVVTEGTEALKNLISAFYTYCGMADTYYNAANIE